MKYWIHTIARGNFEHSLADVQILLRFHDTETKKKSGRPDRTLEVFKRAGVILAVTAWETYVEDSLKSQVQERVKAAKTPQDLQATFNSVAQAWLCSAPKPPDLAKWTGSGWQEVILERLRVEVDTLNTPNSSNVEKLFKRYLGLEITKHWKWQGTASKDARRKLDDLVSLRGQLVHRGKELFEGKASAHRKHVVDAVSLLERLVQCTDEALGVAPEEKE